MEPRAHHVVIGLFTVITLGSALLFALWFGQSRVDGGYAWYEITFDRDVSGLAEGNAVQYSGVEVGNVVDLYLDPSDPREVRALIRVGSDIPVKKDTRASLKLANITGTLNIELSGGSLQSPRLQGNRDDPAPIQTRPSRLRSLLANSEEFFTKVKSLLTNANRLLSEENIKNVTRTLDNLKVVSRTLAHRSDAIDQGLAGFGQAGDEIETSVKTFSRLGEKANGLLEEEGRATLQGAQRAVQSLDATAERLNRLTERHEEPLGRGLRAIGKLDPAIGELHDSLRAINRLVQRLEKKPIDALLGRDEIQEFNQ